MASLTPILANDRTAAKLLDMKPAEFRALVEDGHLPRPRNIGGLERWDVEDLRRIGRGDAVEGYGEIAW
jgi:predicted DNA-binding transcriptional regulator AlpA